MARRATQQQLDVVAQEMPLDHDRIVREIQSATTICDMAYNALVTAVEYRTKFRVKLPVTVEQEMERAIAAAAIAFVQAQITLSDFKALQARSNSPFGLDPTE